MANGDIAAIVLPCSARKAIQPAAALRAISVPRGPQADVASAWQRALAAATPVLPARDLYRGRNFELARQACDETGALMFVVSAGLGLVDSNAGVPGYGLTVAARSDDSIRKRVRGQFSAEKWWAALGGSRFASGIDALFERPGRVLVALTRPYAQMVGPQLAAATARHGARVRIFGAGLETALPGALLPTILPYDARLDALVPGTRSDFSLRALRHFVGLGTRGGDLAADQVTVETAFSGVVPPVRHKRPRLSDDEIVSRIHQHLKSATGIQRILRRLRDDDSIACEQARFTRLYYQAMARTAA